MTAPDSSKLLVVGSNPAEGACIYIRSYRHVPDMAVLILRVRQ